MCCFHINIMLSPRLTFCASDDSAAVSLMLEFVILASIARPPAGDDCGHERRQETPKRIELVMSKCWAVWHSREPPAEQEKAFKRLREKVRFCFRMLLLCMVFFSGSLRVLPRGRCYTPRSLCVLRTVAVRRTIKEGHGRCLKSLAAWTPMGTT